MATLLDILVVVVLILVEGVFSAAEIALVSLRDQQLRSMASRSRRGAAVSRLVADPNRFLATVQIGVTLAALLSSAFGAVTLSRQAARGLRSVGLTRTPADAVGVIGVTLVIAVVSIILGELVPKRLALQRAEGTAQLVAYPLERMARLSRPLIWFLSGVTDLSVRIFGGDPDASRQAITEEELRGLVAAHESLSSDERRLIAEVFDAGERALREVMIPRTEVSFLDAGLSVSRAIRTVSALPYSRYPVIRGTADDVVGFVHVRDLLAPAERARPATRVGELAREVAFLPAGKKVLPALSEMRRARSHLAIVVDEYGGTAGIVTLEDLIEEVIGDIRDEYDLGEEAARQLRSGDLEVDGLLNLDEFREASGVGLPDGPYETAAGFVVAHLGRLPRLGDAVELPAARLTVARLDGRRVERLRVTYLTDRATPAPGGMPGAAGAPPTRLAPDGGATPAGEVDITRDNQ